MKRNRSILIIATLGFLVFANSLFNSFVWDDEEQVVKNTLVHSIKNLPLFFKGSTFYPGGGLSLLGLYYKPLMATFFALIYTLFGPNPFFFHLFQILLHLANSILVFLILRHLLGANKQLPFLLSLIFLVHPINTETVVYISDLQDILFFFFGMLAFFLVASQNKISNAKMLVISLLLLFSLLSKETGVVFIPIILAYLFLFKKELLPKFLISLAPTLAVYSFLRFAVAGIYFQKHGLSPITRMSLLERLVSVPQIILFYLKTFLFPKNLAINQHWVVKSINFTEFYLPLFFVLLFFSGLVILAIFLSRRNDTDFRLFLFFFLLFAISLGLHLQIFPLDLTVSDRWFYLPMVGMLGMVGIAIEQVPIENQKFKTVGFLIVVLLTAALSVRTIIRTFDWRNGLTLYSRDIEISKESFDLENNLGVELFRAGRIEEAKIRFQNSIKLAPHWWTSYSNLGVYYERQGELGKARELYEKAIEKGNYYLAHENLAFIVLKEEEPKKAIETIKKSLAALPYNPKILTALALAYYKDGQYLEAEIVARRLFSLSPLPQNFNLLEMITKRKPIEF